MQSLKWEGELFMLVSTFAGSRDVLHANLVEPLLDDLRLASKQTSLGGGGSKGSRLLAGVGSDGTVWAVAFLRNCVSIRVFAHNFLEYMRAATGRPLAKADVVPEGHVPTVGDALAQFAPLFELFTQYAESRETFLSVFLSAENRSKDVGAFVADCERGLGADLRSVIDAPVELIGELRRLTGLLLNEARSRPCLGTSGDLADQSKREAEQLSAAAEGFKNAQMLLHQASSSHINNYLLAEIRNTWDMAGFDFAINRVGRKLIKQGSLIKVSRKKDIMYQFVLFDDCLIYGSEHLAARGSEQLIGRSIGRKFKLHNVLALENMTVGVISDDESERSMTVADESQTDSLGTALLSTLATMSSAKDRDELSFHVLMSGDKSFAVKAAGRPEDLCDWWIALSKAVLAKRKLMPLNAKTNIAHSPVWQPDHKVMACTRCARPFSTTFRKHHCRVCGLVCCSDCTRNRVELPVAVLEKKTIMGKIFKSGLGQKLGSTNVNTGTDSTSPSEKQTVLKSFRACDICVESSRDLDAATISLPSFPQQCNAGADAQVPSNESETTPKPPPKSPFEAALQNKDQLDARTRIMVEIIETEQTYLEGIKTLKEVYVKPLLGEFRAGLQGNGAEIVGCVNAADLASMLVFLSDVRSIVTLSERLLQKLEDRFNQHWSSNVPGVCDDFENTGDGGDDDDDDDKLDECVGDIFLQMSPLFQLYDEFSSCFEFGTRTIRDFTANKPFFAAFQDRQQAAFHDRLMRVGAQSMQSLLIMPIQRLPRYIMLLREVHKRTPETHPDWRMIQCAVTAVQAMTLHINDHIRAREGLLKLYELETRWGVAITQNLDPIVDRVFVLEGQLTKQSRRSFDTYQFLLCTDVLMYGVKEELSRNNRVAHHRTLKLEFCTVSKATEPACEGLSLVPSMAQEGLESEQESEAQVCNQSTSNSTQSTTTRGTSSRFSLASAKTAGSSIFARTGNRQSQLGQPNHHQRSCETALDILGREKSFRVFAATTQQRDEWESKLQEAIRAVRLVKKREQAREGRLWANSQDDEAAAQAEAEQLLACGSCIGPSAASSLKGLSASSPSSPKGERAPIWVQDGPNCLRCEVAFTPFRRRHHCRNCGVLACSECTPHRLLLRHVNATKPQRVCTECHGRLKPRKQSSEGAGLVSQQPPIPTGGDKVQEQGQQAANVTIKQSIDLSALKNRPLPAPPTAQVIPSKSTIALQTPPPPPPRRESLQQQQQLVKNLADQGKLGATSSDCTGQVALQEEKEEEEERKEPELMSVAARIARFNGGGA